MYSEWWGNESDVWTILGKSWTNDVECLVVQNDNFLLLVILYHFLKIVNKN